jgi:hypothetical protein
VLPIISSKVIEVLVNNKLLGEGLSVITSSISREVIKLGIYLDKDSSVLAT